MEAVLKGGKNWSFEALKVGSKPVKYLLSYLEELYLYFTFTIAIPRL